MWNRLLGRASIAFPIGIVWICVAQTGCGDRPKGIQMAAYTNDHGEFSLPIVRRNLLPPARHYWYADLAENDVFYLKWNDIRLIRVRLLDREVDEDLPGGNKTKCNFGFSAPGRKGQSRTLRQLNLDFPTKSMWVKNNRTNNVYIDGFGDIRMHVTSTGSYGGGVRVNELEVYLDEDLLEKLYEYSGKRRREPGGGWVIGWEHRKPGQHENKPLGQDKRFAFRGDVRAGECPISDCKIGFKVDCREVFEVFRNVRVVQFEETWPAELENTVYEANRMEDTLDEREVLVPKQYGEFEPCEDQFIRYKIDCLREEMETGWNSILEGTDQHGLTWWDARDFARYGVNENDFSIVFGMEDGTIKNDVSASCRVPRAVFVDCPANQEN